MNKCFNHFLRYAFLAVVMLVASTATAKKVVVPQMYMFGFAASFNDTIVHFTNIQKVDSVWVDAKTKFLADREVYSSQLQQYLTNQEMPYRTCVVVYAETREKAEKKYLKLRRLYVSSKKDHGQRYEVRYIEDDKFRFHSVVNSEQETE
jgi:hypothetical protein